MLGALEESNRAQRQLVADASHELRTPLTSLRTNFEVLMSERELAPDERRRLLDDVVEQIAEMTTLIAGLIELARGEEHSAEPEDVRLDLLTEAAVERARRDRPGVTFTTDLERVRRPRRPQLARARDRQPARQRRQVEPAGRRGRGARRGRRGDGPRPRAGHRRRGSALRLRPLLPLARRHGRCRARAWASRSSGRSPRAHGGTVTAERAEGGGTRMTLRLAVVDEPILKAFSKVP